MEGEGLLRDLKFWVFLGIVLGLTIGTERSLAGNMLTVVLICQMTMSLQGLTVRRGDFRIYGKSILWSLVAGFGVNTGIALLMGLLFIDNSALWHGWVILASVPCGVSLIAEALYNRGDVKFSFISLTAGYFCALLLTPLITFSILGQAADPLITLRYIVLFIAIPFAMTFPLKKVTITGFQKTVAINVLTLFIVFFAVSSNRDFILGDLSIVALLLIACAVRIFGVHLASLYVLKKAGVDEGRAVVYSFMAIMKNSGMATTITLGLFATTMPSAALPCVVSLMVEFACFAASVGYMKKWNPAVNISGQ